MSHNLPITFRMEHPMCFLPNHFHKLDNRPLCYPPFNTMSLLLSKKNSAPNPFSSPFVANLKIISLLENSITFLWIRVERRRLRAIWMVDIPRKKSSGFFVIIIHSTTINWIISIMIILHCALPRRRSPIPYPMVNFIIV